MQNYRGFGTWWGASGNAGALGAGGVRRRSALPISAFSDPTPPATLATSATNQRSRKGVLRVPTEGRSALLFENREQNRIEMRRKRGEFRHATDEVAHADLAHAPRGAGESQK